MCKNNISPAFADEKNFARYLPCARCAANCLRNFIELIEIKSESDAKENFASDKKGKVYRVMIIDRIALILTVIGALNWGSIGIFKFDLVAWLCGGSMSLLSRIVYTIVALAGIWCITLIFRARESFDAIGES